MILTKEEAKDILVQYCSAGIKNTELVLELSLYCAAFPDLSKHDISELLEELVREDRIVEIEYILPSLEFRVKSFFLPVGTEIVAIHGPFKGLGRE